MAGGILPLVDTPLLDITDEEDLDPSTDDDGEQDATDDVRQTPTLDQLRKSGDVNDVGRTPVLGSEDVPVEPGSWPIGYPLQAVPRVAVTYNLNFVYNEENEQWERDTGNRGGGVSLGDSERLFPGFGNPVTPNADAPTLCVVEVTTRSEVANTAQIDAIVNESGSGTPDAIYTLARFQMGSNNRVEEETTTSIPVPAGGTIEISNVQDPFGANDINVFQVYPFV
jgi:hypothetical protein